MSPSTTPAMATRPFYFGPDEALFGVLDTPVDAGVERSAVVIFQPVGHEYTWCHRACRTLAARLAEAGHAVLRFDYYGCGDSLGESRDADLSRWEADGRVAVEYLRARYSCVRVVGLRLGATLVLRAAGDGAAHLALWQPVVDGRAYVRELRALHAARARELGLGAESSDAGEVLGFLYSHEALRELDALDASSWSALGCGRVLHLVNQIGDDQSALAEELKRRAAALEELRVEEPRAWVAEPYKMVMPVASIDALVRWAVAAGGPGGEP